MDKTLFTYDQFEEAYEYLVNKIYEVSPSLKSFDSIFRSTLLNTDDGRKRIIDNVNMAKVYTNLDSYMDHINAMFMYERYSYITIDVQLMKLLATLAGKADINMLGFSDSDTPLETVPIVYLHMEGCINDKFWEAILRNKLPGYVATNARKAFIRLFPYTDYSKLDRLVSMLNASY